MLSLYFSKHFDRGKASKLIKKIMLISIIATLIEVLGLLSGIPYSLWSMLLLLLEVPLMMWFLLRKELKITIKMSLIGYFFLILANGILEILWNWFGKKSNYLLLIGLAAITTFAIAFVINKSKENGKGIYIVQIMQSGLAYEAKALYDSGNRLKDPYTGKGVHIISLQLFQKLQLDVNRKVVIPFQSLGNENGLLDVYYIDYMIIHTEKENTERQKIPVGIAKDNLFKEKPYEMILNEEIW